MDAKDAKRFDYVVIGDAGTANGLTAPYFEEERKEITHLEQLDAGMDLFSFWFKHQNTDQVTGRTIQARELEPP